MSRKFINFSAFIVIMVLLYACDEMNFGTNNKTSAEFNPSITYGSMTDQDGNVYKTVTIGTQTWMAENLRTTKYNDGTKISKVTKSSDWKDLTNGAFCTYNNTTNADTIATYGRMYNWYAVITGKLAPKGWHIPTNDEWATLYNYLGGENIAGSKLKESGTTHWLYSNMVGTNSSGFTALPGGIRYNSGKFDYIGNTGYWWSITDFYASDAWFHYITYNDNYATKNYDFKMLGISVRCLKD